MTARYSTHAEQLSLFQARQSAYRHFHSTETAVTSVLNDVIRAAHEGKVTWLVLLDLRLLVPHSPPQDWYLVCDHETISRLLYNNFAGYQSTTGSNKTNVVCQQQCPVYISNMFQSVANSNHRQGLWSSTCPTFVVLALDSRSVHFLFLDL